MARKRACPLSGNKMIQGQSHGFYKHYKYQLHCKALPRIHSRIRLQNKVQFLCTGNQGEIALQSSMERQNHIQEAPTSNWMLTPTSNDGESDFVRF